MDLVKEWMHMREKHPFFGEGLSREKIADIWDRSAETYTDGRMGGIPDMIVKHMADRRILRKDISIMDIGCGPGTYGLRFSPLSESVICLDRSQSMLNRLMERCGECGMDNVSCVAADWEDYSSDARCGVAFSSLCPPLNCPENLLKMEDHAVEWCVYASSMTDDRGSVHMDIWKEFGRDYTFNGYNTEYPYRYLSFAGRDPELTVFEVHEPFEQPAEETVSFETKKFSAYEFTGAEAESVIRKVVERHSKDGMVRFEGIKRIGLLKWRPPGS
ncbi:MAG: class I SAM-dependent methyltransferase [Candidatus Methanoplasma sp.]|jgi:SAM-dependent methyltransferase|nr:class I SAM-dependent methyltransferase [Candidatus Methanoplasma sp.]